MTFYLNRFVTNALVFNMIGNKTEESRKTERAVGPSSRIHRERISSEKGQ